MPRTRLSSSRAAAFRDGFSLVEAMVVISLVAMVGAVLLSATQVSVNSASQAIDETIAQGIARQILDEAMGLPYVGKSFTADAVPPNLNGVEITNLGEGAASGARTTHDDIDDYNGRTATSTYVCQPPCDRWGATLGAGSGTSATLRPAAFRAPAGYFDRWRVETNVYYVDPANLASRLTTGTSPFRAMEVRVYRDDANRGSQLLTTMRRVHCHVPK